VWSKAREETESADVLPLLLLEDLKWSGYTVKLPRRLMGARPATLNISGADVADWLNRAGPDFPTVTSPLARVRALTLKLGRKPPEAAFMARLLREAPHLRQLTCCVRVRAAARWVLSEEFTSEPALAEMVHLKLRHVAVACMLVQAGGPVRGVCGVRLRQRHFPHLDDEEYPV
jgi:hypothetical protein